MRRRMCRGFSRVAAFAAAILVAGVLPAGENDVLYWMIDDTATVTPWGGGEAVSVGDFFSSHELAGEGSAFAARIRVTGGNITEDTFLDLYIPGYGLDEGSGEYGVEFSEVGGYWGAGVPTGNQSPSGNYSAGSPERNERGDGIFRARRLYPSDVRHESVVDGGLDADEV